jgi:hypothetical protein
VGVAADSLTEGWIRVSQLTFGRKEHSQSNSSTVEGIQSRDPEFLAWCEGLYVVRLGDVRKFGMIQKMRLDSGSVELPVASAVC